MTPYSIGQANIIIKAGTVSEKISVFVSSDIINNEDTNKYLYSQLIIGRWRELAGIDLYIFEVNSDFSVISTNFLNGSYIIDEFNSELVLFINDDPYNTHTFNMRMEDINTLILSMDDTDYKFIREK